jgi:hypothetical protein
MAAAPLLPAGLAHAGFPPFAYVELVVAALIAVWAVERIGRRAAGAPLPRMPLRAWHIAIAAIAGAALYGLAAENRLDSVVFRHWVRDAGADVFQPMDHASHPLYPARVALTFVEGWAVFLLVTDLCRRAPDPRRRARQAFAGWMAGVTLAALFAIAQYVTRFNLHPYWVKANPSIVRSHSTLDDPNAGSCVSTIGGALCGWVCSSWRPRA